MTNTTTKRYAGYFKQSTITGERMYQTFLETHYREAGLSPQKLSGMPQLEAHELVNKWNRDQAKPPQYVFILQFGM